MGLQFLTYVRHPCHLFFIDVKRRLPSFSCHVWLGLSSLGGHDVKGRAMDSEQQHTRLDGKQARRGGAGGGRAVDGEQQQRAWMACGGAHGRMASSGGRKLV
jgi:hypothetical protein